MVRDITLGQYFPSKSVLHRMDPRVKILLLLTYIVFIFLGNRDSSGGPGYCKHVGIAYADEEEV